MSTRRNDTLTKNPDLDLSVGSKTSNHKSGAGWAKATEQLMVESLRGKSEIKGRPWLEFKATIDDARPKKGHVWKSRSKKNSYI